MRNRLYERPNCVKDYARQRGGSMDEANEFESGKPMLRVEVGNWTCKSMQDSVWRLEVCSVAIECL